MQPQISNKVLDRLTNALMRTVPPKLEVAALLAVFALFGVAVATQSLPMLRSQSYNTTAQVTSTTLTSKTISVTRPAATADAAVNIQAAINQANPGDTVYFPAGAYYVSSPIIFKSGVTYLGTVDSAGSSVTTRIVASTTSKFMALKQRKVNQVLFKNLRFEYIGMSFEDSVSLVFDKCYFVDGIDKTLSNTADTLHLLFSSSSDITIANSLFWRRTIDHAGRGVNSNMAINMTVKDSKFIGYFKTAINVQGYRAANSTTPEQRSRNIVITNNTMSRVPAMYDEDHGIYAGFMDGLTIVGNTIRGWSLTPSGYSMKIRNGKNVYVAQNFMINSGILTYVYSGRGTQMLQYFENVVIEKNTIDQTTYYPSAYPFVADQPAILYWWTLTSPAPDPGSPAPYEKNIMIRENTIKNGSIKISAARNPEEFQVLNNIGAFAYKLQTGVVASGNQ